jgi:hypothetical protein
VKVKRQVAKVKHDAIFCGLKRITPLRVFWMLDSSHGVTYRGALQFEERCDLIWEAETHFESLVPVPRAGWMLVPRERRTRTLATPPRSCDREAREMPRVLQHTRLAQSLVSSSGRQLGKIRRARPLPSAIVFICIFVCFGCRLRGRIGIRVRLCVGDRSTQVLCDRDHAADIDGRVGGGSRAAAGEGAL